MLKFNVFFLLFDLIFKSKFVIFILLFCFRCGGILLIIFGIFLLLFVYIYMIWDIKILFDSLLIGSILIVLFGLICFIIKLILFMWLVIKSVFVFFLVDFL